MKSPPLLHVVLDPPGADERINGDRLRLRPLYVNVNIVVLSLQD